MNLEESVAWCVEQSLSDGRRVSARRVAATLGECAKRVEKLMDAMAARGEVRAVTAKPKRPNDRPTKYYERERLY